MGSTLKVCTACGQEKPLGQFHRSGDGKRRGKCGACRLRADPGRSRYRRAQSVADAGKLEADDVMGKRVPCACGREFTATRRGQWHCSPACLLNTVMSCFERVLGMI